MKPTPLSRCPAQQSDDSTVQQLAAGIAIHSAVWISSILHFEPAAAAFRIENPFVRSVATLEELGANVPASPFV